MPTQAFATLKDVLDHAASSHQIPGAQFALVTPEGAEVGWTGNRQIVEETLPVERDTLYDLASCSKVVATTTLILKLIEEGKISLDTPLVEILPDFGHPEITIQHLLTHTSGLPADDKGYKKTHGRKEMWDFFKDMPLNFEPGTKVDYSDFGYIALGFVVEHFKGSLDKVAEAEIFEPLRMSSTCYNPKDHGLADKCVAEEVTEARGVIKGVVHDGKGYCLDGISGNAGVFSTADDLSRFVRMLLHDGELDGVRILKPETVDLLKHSFTPDLNVSRTLGWIADDRNQSDGTEISDSCLYHTGFSGTSIYVDFKRNMGIIVLTNRVHPSRDNMAIMDIRKDFHNETLKAFDQESK